MAREFAALTIIQNGNERVGRESDKQSNCYHSPSGYLEKLSYARWRIHDRQAVMFSHS